MRSLPSRPVVTEVLIAINVVAFIVEVATGTSLGGGGGGTVYDKGALLGPAILHQHQYWRLLTSGFLHYNLLHIAFNMFFLYIIGPILEPAIGRVNFAAVYFASLFAGSFGALLFEPDVYTVGASAACFGLLGALIIVARDRGIPIWRSGLGITLVINIVFSVSVAGISIGGHLGGLISGLIAGTAIVELGERRRLPAAAVGTALAVAVISIAGAIAVSGAHGLTPTGFGFGS